MNFPTSADFEAVLRIDAHKGHCLQHSPTRFIVTTSLVWYKTSDRFYPTLFFIILGYQLASLIAPPTYIALTLIRKKPLTLNRTLRATWLAGAGGAGAGAGYSYYEATKGEKYMRDRHLTLAYDVSPIDSSLMFLLAWCWIRELY